MLISQHHCRTDCDLIDDLSDVFDYLQIFRIDFAHDEYVISRLDFVLFAKRSVCIIADDLTVFLDNEDIVFVGSETVAAAGVNVVIKTHIFDIT